MKVAGTVQIIELSFFLNKIEHSLKLAKLTPTKLKNAIIKSYGIISDIARICKVSRTTVYEKLDEYPELETFRKQQEDALIDLSESKLAGKIKSGADWAIKYYLSTKGRKRGYGKEITVNNKNIDINKKMSELEADLPRALPYLERLTKAASMEDITNIIAEYDVARITDKSKS